MGQVSSMMSPHHLALSFILLGIIGTFLTTKSFVWLVFTCVRYITHDHPIYGIQVNFLSLYFKFHFSRKLHFSWEFHMNVRSYDNFGIPMFIFINYYPSMWKTPTFNLEENNHINCFIWKTKVHELGVLKYA